MSKNKASDELYLDICAEFIEIRFGKNPGIQHYPDTDRLYANFVTPEDGGKVCWFDTSDLSWVEADQSATSWCILPDGTVYVANPEDATGDADIQLKVRHPREVAELIHLFVQPSSRLLSKISESHCLKLGEAADLYALIPYGEGFRALDLKRLPADMPVDMLQPLALSLTHDGESLSRGDYSGPSWFAKKWKDFVDSLPDAMPLIRDGYAFNKNCDFGDGLILLGGIRDISGPFLNFLLVPTRDDVSSFYLAEYLNHDLEAYEQHKAALSEGNDLATIYTILVDQPVHLPTDYTDQIRFAVQHNLLKQEVMNSARGLVCHRAQFDQQQSRYQVAVSALNQTLSELLNSSRNRQDNF